MGSGGGPFSDEPFATRVGKRGLNEGHFKPGFDAPLSSLSPEDIQDLYRAEADALVDFIEITTHVENPELALFATGLLAARSMDTSPQLGYRHALGKLYPNLASRPGMHD